MLTDLFFTDWRYYKEVLWMVGINLVFNEKQGNLKIRRNLRPEF